MTELSFTADEIETVRGSLAVPELFHLTEPEIRACQAVIAFYESGHPITGEDRRVAAHLLAALSESP